MIVSFLIRPFFIERYLIPAIGLFWLGISVFLSKNFNKKHIFIPILILIISLLSFVSIYDDQIINDQNVDYKSNLVYDSIGINNTVIVNPFLHDFWLGHYYGFYCEKNNNTVLYELNTDLLNDNQSLNSYIISHNIKGNIFIVTPHENPVIDNITLKKIEVFDNNEINLYCYKIIK